jgi:DNA (cytosine-5)-methyltransferase 1
MDTMHLFAGAGGGLLADLILGHNPIIAVEWDRYACQVLRERASDGWFPDLHVWEGDVRLFDPSEYAGRVDCIHAGFPCQDLSFAGKRSGLGEGTRSGLYREVIRISGIVRPRYIFLENVSAILSGGLEYVLADLATLGYDAQWTCLRASEVGSPHHRDRWWLLAYTKEIQGIHQPFHKIRKKRLSDDSPDWFSNSWNETTPRVRRMDDGMANSVQRYEVLGNGQVPLQAATAWKLLGGP